jgi:TonB-linked SusC/RagA family outer membrane protein
MRNRLQCLLALILFLFPLALHGQDSIVTVRVENVPLKEVFEEIQDKSDYRFFYSDDIPALDEEVSIQVRRMPVNQVLDSLLANFDLNYLFIDNSLIVISPSGNFGEHEVTGSVVSAASGEGLIGVNVSIKGTATGTVTGMDGNYAIQVPGGEVVLLFSYIGYEPQEVPASSLSTIHISLEENVHEIDEVMITALGITREKKALGYSVSEINSEEFNQAKEKNVINSLSGKVSGLQINRTASGVGGSSRVVLRGVSSILGSNRPLFVIDGIPMDVSSQGDGGQWGGKDMGDGMADINAEDVESISVLKGPSAAAAYGSRGANGVILITTKSGKGRKGIGVDFSTNISTETPMVLPRLQNKYGMGGYGVYPPVNPESGLPSREYPWVWSYGEKMEGQMKRNWLGEDAPYEAQPNHFGEFYRRGYTLSNTLSLTAGNETATTRISFTDFRTQGLTPGNDLTRQTFNVRGTARLGSKLSADARITYIHHKVKNRPYLSEATKNHGYMLQIIPSSLPLQELEDNIVDENGREKVWLSDIYVDNPYWVLENSGNQDVKDRIMSFASLTYEFNDWLNLMARTGLDLFSLKAEEWEAQGKLTNPDGSISNSFKKSMEWNSDLLLSGNRDLSSNLNLAVNLGANYRYNQNESLGQSGSQFNIPYFYHISNMKTFSTWEGFSEKAVYSVYGLGQVSYRDYLFVDLTLRNDWSSTLPSGNNSYFYYSGKAGILFTVAFNMNSKVLTFGKLRASYAKVGNDTNPYQTLQYYYLEQTRYPYPLGNMSDQLAFFDFRPEITDSWEVGTQLSFFNRLLELDFTYYWSVSHDQIMSVPISHTTGYTSKKFNAGEISNKGIEIRFSGTPVSTARGFQWDYSLTWTRNNSTVLSLHESLENLVLGNLWAASIQARVGEPYGDIYGIGYKKDNFGRKLIDEKGFAIPGDYQKLGNINPDFLAGFSNTLSWQGFRLSVLLDAQVGGDFFSWGKAIKSLYGNAEETLEGRDEWYATHEGSVNQTPIPGVEPDGYIEEGVKESNGAPNDIPIQPTWRWEKYAHSSPEPVTGRKKPVLHLQEVHPYGSGGRVQQWQHRKRV